MNILVCIKQVPDVEKVKFCPETRTLIREGVENIMNPFDRHALEVALMLKDKVGAKVTCVSMGLPIAADVLKEAIAMGADDVALIAPVKATLVAKVSEPAKARSLIKATSSAPIAIASFKTSAAMGNPMETQVTFAPTLSFIIKATSSA